MGLFEDGKRDEGEVEVVDLGLECEDGDDQGGV